MLKNINLTNIIKKIRANDLFVRMYIYFAFVLAITGVLTGVIFISLYQKNYIDSYRNLLKSQGKIVSKRVAGFAENKKVNKFEQYSTYIDEIEQSEKTDMWIVSKKDAKNPLPDEYTNSVIDENNVSKETLTILEKSYKYGKVYSSATYDKVYGMTTLSVSVPIEDKNDGEVCGAVLMVSMIDRQTLGIKEGIYLITLSIILAFILSYLIALLFSRYLSKPLNRISRHIRKLAGGDFSDIEVKKPDTQIGILENSLDNLAGELRESERQREETDRIRKDFFANVSHELRTPITVIRGYTETLSDGVVVDPLKVDELYHKMLTECRGIERLVEDLFILSKIQNPDFAIETEPVSITQIFSDVIKSGKTLGSEKNITFQTNFPVDNPCLILGDYIRLRQMFMVIVDNAIKFSNQNGKIIIDIEKENNKFRISITDFGVGISNDELPYIFNKFYTSKMRQNQKGTGLGLMIAKQIALRHGGDIFVESTMGEKTTFSFVFKECESPEDFE